MGFRLIPYVAELERAVARSNTRFLASGAAPFLLPDRANSGSSSNAAISRQHYLALSEDGEVRGGCLLQYHPGWVDGAPADVVNLQSPLSEGLFDIGFAGLATWMMREVLRRHPFAYCVGMGGEQLSFPRLLRALGWRVEPVPFYFRVLAGRRFLANAQPLQRHPTFGMLARAGGAIPLLPDLAFALFHALRAARREPQAIHNSATWETIRSRYAFAVERTPGVLDALYPPGDAGLLRLHVPGGFGVVRTSQFHGHGYFGNLRFATLAEAICETGAARSLLRAAVAEARATGAGLLLTNQTAPEIQSGLEAEGWLRYQSNFLLALSPPLAARIGQRAVYVTRGDGDGLLNL